jgi:hypothetical protein
VSRAAASAGNHRHAPGYTARPGPPLAVADRKQAELFKALLGKHRNQMADDIRNTAAAIAHHHNSGDSLTSHRLRQTLEHMSRKQNELDQLCDRLRDRLNTDATVATESPRSFDIIITRRRSNWYLRIPKFSVALANIASRTDAEDISRSLISAITGLPTAAIVIRSLVD